LFNFSGLGSGTGGGFSGVTPTFNFGIKPPASGGGSAPAFSFGSTAAKPFSFAGAGAAPQGGGFSFGNGGLASFSSVGGSGWGTKKDGEKKSDAAGDEKGSEKEGGGGGEGGDDGGGDGGEGEDPEKEVSIRKGDGIVQLEEVETTTGEEEECTVFQVSVSPGDRPRTTAAVSRGFYFCRYVFLPNLPRGMMPSFRRWR
jgi:hypothetical protein